MKKFFLKILFLLFFVALSYSVESVVAKDGVLEIDKETIDLSKSKISLSGKWKVYKNCKFDNDEYLENTPEYKVFPKRFISKVKSSVKVGDSKTAIYEMMIKGLKPNFQYAIFSRQSPSTASKFFCNNELKDSYGICSDKQEEHKSEIRPVFLFLTSDDNGQIDLKIQISSFNNYDPEMVMPIVFAEKELILIHTRTVVAVDVFLISAFLFCGLYNFLMFLKNKKNKEKLTVSVMFALMSLHIIITEGSLFITNMQGVSYDIILWAQNIFLWLFPVMFSYIFFMDKEFKKRFPIIDKAFTGMFSVLGVVFLVEAFTKVNISHFRYLALFLNLVFYVYSILRVSFAASKKQKNYIVNIMFYVWIYTAVFIDFIFIDFFAKQVILYTEVAFVALIFFDVVYMAYVQQSFFIKARKSLVELKYDLAESQKFVSPNFKDVIKKNPEDIKLGDYVKKKMTIMYIHLQVVVVEDEYVNTKEEFEIYNLCLKLITSCLEESKQQSQKKDGLVSKYLRDGCVLLFEDSPNNALLCAKKIMNAFKEYNIEAMELKTPWIVYSAAIHTGDVVVCALGEEERYSTGIVGKGISEVQQILNLAMNQGVLFLVSEQTILSIKEKPLCTIEKREDLVVYSDNSEIKLYECK